MKFLEAITIRGWLIAILLFFALNVEGQSIRYSNFYDSMDLGAEILKDALILDNGSLFVAGGTASGAFPYIKTYNVVVGQNGTIEYSIERSDPSADIIINSVVKTGSNAIFEAGTRCDYESPSPGPCDFYVAKLDETGDTLFTKVIERPDTSDYLLDLVQTRPNKLLMIGWTYDDTVAVSSAADLLFITVDTLGNELNRVVWGGNGTDYIHSGLVINADGEVLMTGYTRSFGGSGGGRCWLVKTDSIGNVIWHQEYSGVAGDGSGTDLVKLPDGNFAIVGGNNGFGGNEADAIIVKVNPDGGQVWAREYPSDGEQGLWASAGLEDGSIVACGSNTNTNDNSQAGLLIKVDANGDTLWTRTYNPSGLIDRLLNMVVMPNGDIVMVGSGRAPGQTNQDGWVLRVDSMGCVVENCFLTGVNEELEIRNEELSLYPNPNHGTFTVQLPLAATEEATMEVYSISGQLVHTERLYAGSNQLQLNAANGLYLYRVMVNREPKWLGKISLSSE